MSQSFCANKYNLFWEKNIPTPKAPVKQTVQPQLHKLKITILCSIKDALSPFQNLFLKKAITFF